jgi:hypothetical protein
MTKGELIWHSIVGISELEDTGFFEVHPDYDPGLELQPCHAVASGSEVGAWNDKSSSV